MSRKPPVQDIDEAQLEVEGSAHAAAGVTAVAVSMKRSSSSARTMARASSAVTSGRVVASMSKRSLPIHDAPPTICTSWTP